MLSLKSSRLKHAYCGCWESVFNVVRDFSKNHIFGQIHLVWRVRAKTCGRAGTVTLGVCGMKTSCLGYCGPEWDRKVQDRANPNFWKYGVANLIFLDWVKNKKRVLDVGCGTGGLTLFLAEHCKFDCIIGVDPVRSMVEVARQHALERDLDYKTDFVICDGRQLPFKRSCFDALVSRGDAFVFLVPQETALLGFKQVLENGAIAVIEIDNVRWEAGTIVSQGFERLTDGGVSYSVEYFDRKRNHVKVFHVLNPQGAFAKKICRSEEFVKTGRLQRRFPLQKIENETIETRRGAMTHWPTVGEMRRLFTKKGFKDVSILGDGLLMGLVLEGDQRLIKTIQRQPQLFFEIEKKLVQFVDPKKAYTIILKATA